MGRQDVGAEDGLLVHDWLQNLGDVWGSDWSVNWDGVGLVDWHGVWLVNWDWLGHWDGLGHADQLDSLHWHWREVTTGTETVTSKTGWGRDGNWGGNQRSTVAQALASKSQTTKTAEVGVSVKTPWGGQWSTDQWAEAKAVSGHVGDKSQDLRITYGWLVPSTNIHAKVATTYNEEFHF